MTLTVLKEEELQVLVKLKTKLQKIYLEYYNLLIRQNL